MTIATTLDATTPAAIAPPRAWYRDRRTWLIVLALVLAFAGLGFRGLWDPDEGRYTNVALHMLDSGDWLTPMRNDSVGHWTKPPLVYWAIASSVAVFGQNAFAARLPSALSWLLCIAMMGRIGRRLAPGEGLRAAIVYAAMLFPFGAGQLITTDYLLTATETLAVWAFVEARFGATHPRRWMLLMWVGFALAFLTKGPPGLLPLLPLLVFDVLAPSPGRARLFPLPGLALFVALALPWYAAVTRLHPGLLGYFLGDEVVGRIASDQFKRHGEWYGWFAIYAPTLLLGVSPWWRAIARWLRRLPAQLRSWRDRSVRVEQRAWLLAVLWLLLPLLVFCISRSRLPLYILPLFGPLALLAALQNARDGRLLPGWVAMLGWAALMMTLKIGSAFFPTHKDAQKWAQEIHARTNDPIDQVVFVDDMLRYGLHLHLGLNVEIVKVSFDPINDAKFNPEYDGWLDAALHHHRPHALWIAKQDDWTRARTRIEARGFTVSTLGAPYQGRVMFRVAPR